MSRCRSHRLPFAALFFLLFAALLLSASSVFAASPDFYAVNSDPGVIQRFDGVTGAAVSSLNQGNYLTGSAFGPDGALYISSAGANQILRYDPADPKTAPVTTFIAGGSGGMNTPEGLAFGPDGALYVLSQNSVLRFNGTTGAFLNVFVPLSTSVGGLSPTRNYIFDLAFGPDGNLYVTSGNGILQYNGTTGAFMSVFVPTGAGGFNEAYGFAFGPDGKLYVANGDGSVLRFSGSTGAFQDVFVPAAQSFNTVFGLTFGPDGALYLSSDTNPNGSTNNSILRYNGSTGVYMNVFASLPSLANFLAFGPLPASGPQELITNGGFETGDFTGWTLNTESGSQGQGSFYNQTAATALPVEPNQTVGPASGSRYAIASEGGATADALSQTFTVPGPSGKVTLSYDMFVNSFASSVIGAQGLDFKGAPNQQARVDLLTSTALPLSTAPLDLLQTFYDGVDSAATANPHPYTHYTFDITSLVGQGGTYTLRFAQVDNQNVLALGVDNVSVQYTPGTLPPPAPFTIAISPGTALGGGPQPTLTLTLNQPAQPGPDPSGQNLGQYGAVIRLDTSPSVQILNGPQQQGYFFHGSDGTAYVLIQTGSTTAATPLQTSFISVTTTATVKATYASASAFATVTLNPYKIQSVSVTPVPASVTSGQAANATISLNAPAVPSPDPRAPASTINGALVFLTVSPGAKFADGTGTSTSQGYVFIPVGQTSITVPISTGYVPSTDTTGVTASFNGSSVTGPLTINPTLVQSFTVSPTSVYNGTAVTATLTLNSPAVPGPDPAAPGTSVNGAVIALSTDNPAALFSAGNATNGGSVFQDQNGHFYAVVPAGQTTISFLINTQFVAASTTANLSATLNGTAIPAALTITPTLVQSVTVSPTSVYNGNSSSVTLTLNNPAIPGPNPAAPGITFNGAVVLLGTDNPAAVFSAGNTTNGGSVFQDQYGHSYVTVPAGQTTVTFPISTQFVAANTTANISGTLNGAPQSAALTITPTLVKTFTVSPAAVYNSLSATATLTLNGPAIYGPNSSGAIVRLDIQYPGTLLAGNATNGGAVFQGQDGHYYAFVPAGQTTISFPVGTQYVAASTTVNVSATLNGTAVTAALTITPTLVQSLTLSPSALAGGQPSAVTLVLNNPAIPGPNPAFPGSGFNGAVVRLDTDNPAAVFSGGNATNGGSVFQDQYGHFYAAVPTGQTTVSFPVGTQTVTSSTVVHLKATLNSGSQSAALTVVPAFSGAAVTQVRFFPRAGYASRMVGGRFQGSVDGVTYVDLAAITRTPAANEYATLPVTDPIPYRFLRYLAPSGSYGNVAEIEFDSSTGKITGTPFGTPGSYNNSGNTYLKALDGNTGTYFDAPAPGNGDFVGIDRAYAVASQARFVPRAGFAYRMVGGKFQGSADGVTYVDLAAITQAPAAGQYTTLGFAQPAPYRFLRYLSPNGSYGDIAELEFDGSAGKIGGTPFGTPGSYNNSGSTFLKAFDGSVGTFFDAPAPGNGDFAGIDQGPH